MCGVRIREVAVIAPTLTIVASMIDRWQLWNSNSLSWDSLITYCLGNTYFSNPLRHLWKNGAVSVYDMSRYIGVCMGVIRGCRFMGLRMWKCQRGGEQVTRPENVLQFVPLTANSFMKVVNTPPSI